MSLLLFAKSKWKLRLIFISWDQDALQNGNFKIKNKKKNAELLSRSNLEFAILKVYEATATATASIGSTVGVDL